MEIGNKISELRKKNALSQENLAEKIGVTRQTISKWELGETSPDLKQANLLAKILKVSLDELANNDVEFVCNDNLKNDLFKELIGKKCYLNIEEDFFDLYLNYNTPVKVIDVNSDFIKIEYQKKQKKVLS